MHGGTYILGPQSKITELQLQPQAQDGASHPVSFRIPAHLEPITTDLLIRGSPLEHSSISKTERRPSSWQANCVAVLKGIPPSIKAAFESSSSALDDPEDSEGVDAVEMAHDVLLLIFPPGSGEATPTTAIRALIMGSGTGSCPSGECKLLPVKPRAYFLPSRTLQSSFTCRQIWRMSPQAPRTGFFLTSHAFWAITQQNFYRSTHRPRRRRPPSCPKVGNIIHQTLQASRPCMRVRKLARDWI